MNIALAALSCNNVTGIGRIVRSLAIEYVKSGHTATVITQAFDSVPAGIRPLRMWKPPISGAARKLLFSLQTRSIFSRARFDITNSFGVGRGAQIVSAQSCHRAGMEAKANFGRGRLGRRGLGVFDAVSLHDERVLMSEPSPPCVIAVSRLVRDELIRCYGISKSIIKVIPDGIHPLPDRPSGEERKAMRSQAGADERDFLLLFIGNEFDRKGLQTIIEAMALLMDRRVRLLVAGDDDGIPYERQAGRLGVREQIHFMGKIDGVERLYGAADAFVLPTYYEPFGMVIIEAMAAGIPVITSAAAGAVEDLEHATHGLFVEDPLSAEELAVQVRRLMDDGELSRRLGAAGREASKRFLWERVARETLDVYSDVIKGASADR